MGASIVALVALALIGLWDHYSQQAAALGFRSIYEWHLASQANVPAPRQPIAGGKRGMSCTKRRSRSDPDLRFT